MKKISIVIGIILFSYSNLSANSMHCVNQTNSILEKEKLTPNFIQQDNSLLVDSWKVEYKSDTFNGSVIYKIRKVKKKFNAYLTEYQNANGDNQKVDGGKILEITSFNGDTGKGFYLLKYQGETYKVKCKIKIIDNNTFTLKYDYYGYAGVETWERQ